MENVNALVRHLCAFLWNYPMPLLLMGTHLYFTVRLHFIQRKVPCGIRLSLQPEKEKKQGMSPYGALATALAATIGTGNIIGISTAIALGGPGALFWCWLSGLFGMATCYAECFLSAKYKVIQADHTAVGGPMFLMERVLHKKGMAVLFAFLTVLASFCVGSGVQAHALTAAVTEQLPLSPHVVGMAAALLAGSVLLGGAKKTAKVCMYLVPVMSLLYLAGCLYVLVKNAAYLPQAVRAVFIAAFSKKAVIGGVAGSAVLTAVRIGMARGLFTNEAGMGSMPMTAATVMGIEPEKQGLISMTGIFWDTLVMCAITGLAVLSDMVKEPQRYRNAVQDTYCFLAFENLPFAGKELLSLCLVLFAFATIIGWSFYGESAARYLWKDKGIKLFDLGYMVFVYLGSVLSLELVWNLSDLMNACMAIPNILCLWMLRKEVKAPDKII